MKELQLKYGCNPNQKPSRVYMENGSELPITVLNGRPGYINLLDAFNGWQLVKELKKATGKPAATSFKHVSPAGAAIGLPLSDVEKKIYWVEDMGELSPLGCAYARARGADRMSSFGDFISLSDPCDVCTAKLIAREVSDGIIAPGYEEGALEILSAKKKGNYAVIQIDPSYVPEPIEHKQVFGVTFEQGRNELVIDDALFANIVTKNRELPSAARDDLAISLIALKYTQSNSVCYVKGGQCIGIGAGQQSRIHCTRLAGDKADKWYLRQAPQVLELPFREDIRRADRDNSIDLYLGEDYMDVLADGKWQNIFTSRPDVFTAEDKRRWLDGNTDVALGSDAFFPFGDNIERAFRSGVKYVAEPGGSVRDDNVIAACDAHDMVMCFTGIRLFHH
jgi:phosphoribosylaminoimidazolecarboxamide formyltransferase/IMP cyclohydrolase